MSRSGQPQPPPPSSPRPRPLANHPWVIGVLLAVFVASVLLPLIGGTAVRICPFYLITGLPCPGCGMGRSFCALSWGDPWHALEAHLLGPATYLFFLGLLIVYSVEWLRGRRIVWPAWTKPTGKILAWALLLGTLLAWGLRLAGLWPLPE